MNPKDIFTLFLRYFILLVVGAFGMNITYALLTPVTAHSSFLILNIFYSIGLEGSRLIFEGASINLIPACIAGAAYYFLLILNLSTPMPIKLRLKSLGLTIGALFVLNTLRIVLFSALFVSRFSYFDTIHESVWYFGSTLLVVAIWFLNVYLFRIMSIPAYTDLKNLFDMVISNKKTKKTKK